MPPSMPFVHPRTRALRVFVADDNRDAADSLADLLMFVGCEVATCYDGEAVLPFAKQFDPDVCILDLWMPGADGWEAARRLRRWAGPLLLVALTGVEGAGAAEDSARAGFDLHMIKPADPNEILRHLSAFARGIDRHQ